MSWMPAIPLNELKQVIRHKLKLNNHDILLLWHQNEVHAIQAKCPHLNLPLIKGELTKDCAIICPFHKSTFDLKSGDVACWSPWPPVIGKLLGKVSKEKELTVYQTRIDGDMILVDTQ